MKLEEEHCAPSPAGTPPLTDNEEDGILRQVAGWRIDRTGPHELLKDFRFPTYLAGIAFAGDVGALAEKENHHPVMTISYKLVRVALNTHSVGGLSRNDFILAAKIDALV